MRFTDCHSHRYSGKDVIRSYYKDSDIPNHLFSCGLHPWHLKTKKEFVEKNLAHPNMVAIGECGLDRAIETPLEEQMAIFLWQLELAQNFEKPIIIHCVRAFSDLLEIFKEKKLSIPIIFHDYRGNYEQALQLKSLLNKAYFSFGESLIKNKKSQETFKKLAKEDLLLETDESEYSIEDIHLMAQKIHSSEISVQINSNWDNLFNPAETRKI